MSLRGQSASVIELSTIVEAPVVDQRLSGSPEPIDPQESRQFEAGLGAPDDFSKAYPFQSRADTVDNNVQSKALPINFSAPRNQTYPKTHDSSGDFPLPPTAITLRDGLPHVRQNGAGFSRGNRTQVLKTSQSSSRKSTAEGVTPFQDPLRQSTGLTSTSASFEETEAWDRKAILTLGMSSTHR